MTITTVTLTISCVLAFLMLVAAIRDVLATYHPVYRRPQFRKYPPFKS